MLNWITANLSTIVISAILLAIVTSISLHLIRQKKQGRSSCGCNCAHCAMHGQGFTFSGSRTGLSFPQRGARSLR